MKLIATGKNGYLNADYVIGITVVEQGNKFVVKVDFRDGTNAIIGSYDMKTKNMTRRCKQMKIIQPSNKRETVIVEDIQPC